MRHSLFLLAALSAACDPDASDDTSDDTADTDTSAEADTDAERDTESDTDGVVSASEQADDLLYMREEEKLARDVYQVLGDEYGLMVFSNIRDSEQGHMDALLPHITRLGLTDPIVDDSTGAFVDTDLQALYAALIEQGEQDLVGALTVGATIEDLDIVDLELAIDRTDDPALATTYELLMCGSRNHLRAFMRQLGQRGEDYTPQYMTQDAFDTVVAGSNEQCN